jgi:hypothetical protein
VPVNIGRLQIIPLLVRSREHSVATKQAATGSTPLVIDVAAPKVLHGCCSTHLGVSHLWQLVATGVTQYICQYGCRCLHSQGLSCRSSRMGYLRCAGTQRYSAIQHAVPPLQARSIHLQEPLWCTAGRALSQMQGHGGTRCVVTTGPVLSCTVCCIGKHQCLHQQGLIRDAQGPGMLPVAVPMLLHTRCAAPVTTTTCCALPCTASGVAYAATPCLSSLPAGRGWNPLNHV